MAFKRRSIGDQANAVLDAVLHVRPEGAHRPCHDTKQLLASADRRTRKVERNQKEAADEDSQVVRL